MFVTDATGAIDGLLPLEPNTRSCRLLHFAVEITAEHQARVAVGAVEPREVTCNVVLETLVRANSPFVS